MGQIIYGKQKPKFCNLAAIQIGGSKANTVLANGEIWLVDTTNTIKANEGAGVYDAYIIGDGNKAANSLTVEYLTARVDLSDYSTTAQMNAAIQSAVSGKQDSITSVNVNVDDNTGTPSGSASVSGGTLTINLSNLKGVKGDTGSQGPKGDTGEAGPEGPAGITGDVSDLTIRQIIDESTNYESTDVTGAKASKIINAGVLDDEEALAGILMDLNDKKANREELPNTDNLELVASAAITDLKDRIIPNEFIQEISLNKLVEDGAYYVGGLLVTDGSIYGGSNVGIHYIFANNNYHKIYAKTEVRNNATTGNGVIAFYSSSNDISTQSFISSVAVSAFSSLQEYYANVPANTKLISVSFGADTNSSVYEGQDIKVYRDIRKIDFRPIVDNLVTSSSNKSLSAAMGADLYSDMLHNDAAHARAMQKGRPFMKNVFLDCGRKFFSVANIKRIIDKMATVDLRNLVLDYSNHQGFRFALDDMTVTTSDGITYDISQGLSTDYLSQSDMDEIITYAKNKNINIIGGLNLPGHAKALLRPIFNSSGINLDSETQQQFAAAITEKYATYFESKGAAYYYLGGDESGAHAKYGFFMNRMMHIILKHNMIPLIWNDQICRSDHGNINTPYINDGAICMFWGANNQGAQTIERNNFQQVNSSMSIYWILGPNSNKVTIEGMNQFNINVFHGNSTVRKNIVGAQFCMWMDGAGGVEDLDNDGTDVVDRCLPLIEAFGNTIMNQTGIARTSTYRPTNPTAGDFFYDTTINKPIWYNGTNWVDATGTNV